MTRLHRCPKCSGSGLGTFAACCVCEGLGKVTSGVAIRYMRGVEEELWYWSWRRRRVGDAWRWMGNA